MDTLSISSYIVNQIISYFPKYVQDGILGLEQERNESISWESYKIQIEILG